MQVTVKAAESEPEMTQQRLNAQIAVMQKGKEERIAIINTANQNLDRLREKFDAVTTELLELLCTKVSKTGPQ